MKVKSMRSSRGNDVPNQFIISDDETGTEWFQSYDSVIAKRYQDLTGIKTVLDEQYWNYSRTTSRYLAIFLCETGKDIKAKVKSGRYPLVNLN